MIQIDMDIPKTCDDCPFHIYHSGKNYVCVATPLFYPMNLANYKGGRKDFCPLIEVPQEPRWIPVSEGNLPDKNGLYLVTYDYKPTNQHEVIIARFHIPKNEDDEFRWYDETDIEITLAVTAWMPLPEPYKPQESEYKE